MKIAYFDCFSGASGDMILGALIDSGFSLDKLTEELKKLDLKDYELGLKKVLRSEITGTKFDVLINKEKIQSENNNRRTINDITKIVNGSTLSERIKKIVSESLKTWQRQRQRYITRHQMRFIFMKLALLIQL